MTETKMAAGRELDAEVARKVMGLRIERNAWDTRTCDDLTPRYDLGVREPDGHIRQAVPNYSRSIAAAWLVVEKMQADGHLFNIMDVMGTTDWVAEFHGKGTVLLPGSGECATADTAPLAICLAALAAAG